MDVLADLLARGRARGALFAQTPIARGGGVEFGGARLLAIHTIAEGAAWFERDGSAPVRLEAGDLALVPAGAPYRVVARPGAPARPHVLEATPDCSPGTDAARLVCGAYTMEAVLSELLLGALPPLVPIRAADAGHRTQMVLTLLAEELTAPEPGTQTILDRSLDLLLALSLRAWFARADGPGLFAALDDPVAGPALAAIHADPARAWTVAALAAQAGMSRAAFAKRFTGVVGQPPMRYLTGWRLSIAAQLLADDRAATIAAVATRVGYGNEYAFATAFRRRFGAPPGRWRRRAGDPR